MTDAILTMNEEDYKLATKKFPKADIEFIPGVGVDIKSFCFSGEEKQLIRRNVREELRIPQKAFVMTYVGELIKRKNHPLLIKMMKELPGDIYFLVVGSGKREGKLRALAEKEKVSDKVLFAGYRKDIPQLYAASDLCLFSSSQEGLPVALMEGMASGLPCVASDIRGCRDLLGFRKEWLFDLRKPSGCRDAVMKLHDDPELCYREGLACREHVRPYDIGIVREQMENIYKKYKLSVP